MKIVVPIFEVKEYSFTDTSVESTSQFRNKMELLDKYKEIKDMSSDETMKLYVEVKHISNQNVSLIAIRGQDHKTLNFTQETNDKVVEMEMDL